ncbi:hypothetical protein N7470_008995 [Penicillium chermesinum]|nr:hypothetical protein N7470_008995 [Penicillium chermesinum]
MCDCLYWLVGTINRDGGDIIRLSTAVRGVESTGQAILYGINSMNSSALSGAVTVKLSLFAACINLSAFVFVIYKVGIVDGVKIHDILQDQAVGDAEDPGIKKDDD